MPNLVITDRCQRSCAYCFARAQRLDAGGEPRSMDRSTFERAVEFVARSGLREVRLLGGEPTLHPELEAFCELALARGMNLRIFTNGAIPEAPLRYLLGLRRGAASLLVNLSASLADPARLEPVLAVLSELGPRAMVGVNVVGPRGSFGPPGVDDAAGFLLGLVDRCRLRREIRVGLAHPCVDYANDHLPPRAYPLVGQEIVLLARRAVARSVRLRLDCGFVPCMAPALLEPALRVERRQISGRCRPVLDVLPDGRVVPCFPLARVSTEPLPERERAAAVRARTARRLRGLRTLGVYAACATCDLRARGACSGGCLAAAMQRLHTPTAG